jgi:hypothetical protein
MGMPIIEPFFITVALYDIEKEKKISEDYSFEMNTDENLSMLNEKDKKFFEDVRKTRIYGDNRVVFQIEKPSPKIVLGIWIEKIFTGELSDLLKYYKGSEYKFN